MSNQNQEGITKDCGKEERPVESRVKTIGFTILVFIAIAVWIVLARGQTHSTESGHQGTVNIVTQPLTPYKSPRISEWRSVTAPVDGWSTRVDTMSGKRLEWNWASSDMTTHVPYKFRLDGDPSRVFPVTEGHPGTPDGDCNYVQFQSSGEIPARLKIAHFDTER